MRDITDGTTNVFLIGEQSDWLYDINNNLNRYDGRSSGGGLYNYGWPMGTCCGSAWNQERQFSLTTINSPINSKKTAGQLDGDLSANFPIQSAHTGGAQLLVGDGTVRFVSENINYSIFQMLCTKDDNQQVGQY
jgi:hypothetical protein